MTNLRFKLSDEYTAQQLFDTLGKHYLLKKEQVTTKTITFFDTFDWRLFNKSLVLYKNETALHLRKLNGTDSIHTAKVDFQPAFIWDFPDCALKNEISSTIKMRTLLNLVEIHTRSTALRVLNADEKTVAWVVYKEIQLSNTPETASLKSYVSVRLVRGYPKYPKQITGLFTKLGFKEEKEDIFLKALNVAGKKPGDYSAKISLKLNPQMPADEATKVVLRFLLQVMKDNETGVKNDVDTEFLHDFRVAVRRTRSALSQVKFVFPENTTNRFKQDFSYVGKLSNDLRDLDVYLLSEQSYREMLPVALQNDVDPLFDYLRKKRKKALSNVVRGLNSKNYRQIIQEWETFLNEPTPNDSTATNTAVPVIKLAQKRIYRRYQVVVKDGTYILQHTEDQLLHDLRIECKKLRYLMEFFTSLFPRQKINRLIGQLKMLQDNLGDFNDLDVQEEYLLNIAQELPITNEQSRKTVLAIGSMVETLNRERQIVKNSFAKTFKNFASPKNQALFQELFAIKKQKRGRK